MLFFVPTVKVSQHIFEITWHGLGNINHSSTLLVGQLTHKHCRLKTILFGICCIWRPREDAKYSGLVCFVAMTHEKVTLDYDHHNIADWLVSWTTPGLRIGSTASPRTCIESTTAPSSRVEWKWSGFSDTFRGERGRPSNQRPKGAEGRVKRKMSSNLNRSMVNSMTMTNKRVVTLTSQKPVVFSCLIKRDETIRIETIDWMRWT